MKFIGKKFACALAFSCFITGVFAQEQLSPMLIQAKAPPPAAPAIIAPERPSESPEYSAAATLYSIGDPTAEEQQYLEYINRARSAPPAEGLLLAQTTDPDVLAAYAPTNQGGFGVNLTVMVSQFALIPATQPLAFNEKLIQAARRHSQDMFQNIFQEHTGSDGSIPSQRVTDAGYIWQKTGENIYNNAESVFQGHAAFEVDWGGGTNSIGGMQNPPGHRKNIHDASFREAGVGVVLGINGTPPDHYSGPQSVTQELAVQQNAKPFITGVAYYDLNTNKFYDLNEGIGGVSVTVNGQFLGAVTARSGGYAVPVAGNGTYTVVFSGTGLNSTNTVTVANLLNKKLDFAPAYTPPVISGPASPGTNAASTYAFTPVGNAIAYQWQQFQKTPPLLEGAENGDARVSITTSAPYEVFATDIKKTGLRSFHLTHLGAGTEILEINPAFLVGNNASISFQSRLGWAASDEHAVVQLSTDGGTSWTTLYDQAGSNGAGETIFNSKTRSLVQYAGSNIRVRFVYDFTSGSYYPSADAGVGWYIDDISFSGVDEITNVVIADAGAASFQFQPQGIGTYGLQVRAKTGHDFLPWGPISYVQSVAAALEIGFSTVTKRVDGSFDLDFEVRSGTAPASFKLQAKGNITDTWADQTATVQTVSTGKYRINVPAPTAGVNMRFFRITAN
jgi:hypothetical protein